MSRTNTLIGRFIIGSAIGGVLGLILLLMGIAVVLNALDSREDAAGRGLEIERREGAEDHAPDDDDHDEYGYEADTVDKQGLDDTNRYLGPAYPQDEAPPTTSTAPHVAEPLPPSMRSQWRSIFEDDVPAPRPAPVPSPPATALDAPIARPAPKAPTAPRAAPHAKRDEESLFF